MQGLFAVVSEAQVLSAFCSLKVFMQTSDSEAVSSFEESFAVMSYMECWLLPSKTKFSNTQQNTAAGQEAQVSLQTVPSLIQEAVAPKQELLRAGAA